MNKIVCTGLQHMLRGQKDNVFMPDQGSASLNIACSVKASNRRDDLALGGCVCLWGGGGQWKNNG